ncbi:MAG: ATP synthase F1 subunit delta [Planctomycetota bacterium]
MPQALDMSEGMAIADVYATALFDLAQRADRLDEVREELEQILAHRSADPQVRAFWVSEVISDEVRGQVLEKALRGRISDLVLDTLLVMNRHGRIQLLPQLARTLTIRIEAARNQVEVMARTAVEADPEQQAAVERLARDLSGKHPVMRWSVEPELLGGLVLEIGDKRYDNSIRRHLLQARELLLARLRRGEQSSMNDSGGSTSG